MQEVYYRRVSPGSIIAAFIDELLRAADQMQRKFDELGVSDQEGLQAGARKLRSTVANSKIKTLGTCAAVVEHIA